MFSIYPTVDMLVPVRHLVLHFEYNYNYSLIEADPERGLKQGKSKDLIGDCWVDCHCRHSGRKCVPKLKYRSKAT